MTQQIGFFSEKVVDLLKLDIEINTPIYIGDSNIEHIKNRHPYEYDLYFSKIDDIISNPDYVGQNPSDKSIAFVKTYQLDSEFIRVAVRITPSGRHFAKTLHLLSTHNAERYIEKGTLIKC